MKYSLRTHNITVTDMDLEQMEKKLETLKKHLTPPFVVDITCAREKLKTAPESITCSITIGQGKKVFHAERTEGTLQSALDKVINAIQKELGREHDKRKRHGGGVQR